MRRRRAGTTRSTGPPARRRLAVGLADGDPLSTFGLRRLLRSYADRVSVVDAMAAADLVLVDPHLHLTDITDVADLLKTMSADGVVVYTWAAASGPSGPGRLKAAGWPLRGWLSKGLEVDTLVDALERIHGGGWVSLEPPDPIRWLRAVPSCASRVPRLTPREAQVMSLIAAGLTNRQIADRSYLGVNTVNIYVRSAYRKMGVSRRSQAVIWADGHGHVAWPPTVVGRGDER